jgi:endonuclease/exonuclease/phosphatase family metal-dependent hydrolase
VRWAIGIVLVTAAVLRAGSCGCGAEDPPVRIATFNIEDFPRDGRQIDGAFDELAALGAEIVAVQEIVDPGLFQAEAVNRLGGAWQFVAISTAPYGGHPTHHLGVLFDRRTWTLVDAMPHDETRLGATHKPTLEVRLRPAGGGDVLRLLVVHLKAGGENADIRARQHAALAKIIGYRRERTIVLGDFNATADPDRASIAALARNTSLVWASEPLACSAFWSRDDGCYRSRLDHVLMWQAPASVRAAGGCATHGCEWEASCPNYAHEVSDHCPVVIEIRDE